MTTHITTADQVQPPARRHLPAASAAAALAMAFLAAAAPVCAQDSRTDMLTARQAEKAHHLHPYEPDGLERRLQMIDATLFTITDRPLYPTFGTSFAGGGLAIGAGYRVRYGDTGAFDAHASWSFRNDRTADAALTLPALAEGRVKVVLAANRIDAPRVAFYGVGNTSGSSVHADFGYAETAFGVSTTVQLAPFVSVGGGLDVLQLAAEPDAAFAAPARRPDYRRSHLVAALDTRTAPTYSRRGSLARIEWSDYHQTNAGLSSFNRTDVELQRFVPLRHERIVLAFRALGSTTSTRDGNEVPYFLLPELGGAHALRGYPSWRFRDRHRLLVSGEYRWLAGPLVDMALFMDAGQVAPRVDDFEWRAFKTSYGLGISLHTPTSTVMRFEVARTTEGTSLVASFGPSF
jgi:hypothetical protein